MPEITLDATQIMAIQRLLRRIERDEIETDEIEIPDEPLGRESWINSQLRENGYESRDAAHEDDPYLISQLEEQYHHATDTERMLYQLANMCPICGDTECDDGVAYVGATPIHASQHPEAKAERAMDNRGGHR